MPVYLTLQLMGCAAICVATDAGGLLHRLFTIAVTAVIFCHIIPAVADRFPLGNMMPLLPGLSSSTHGRSDGMTDSYFLYTMNGHVVMLLMKNQYFFDTAKLMIYNC